MDTAKSVANATKKRAKIYWNILLSVFTLVLTFRVKQKPQYWINLVLLSCLLAVNQLFFGPGQSMSQIFFFFLLGQCSIWGRLSPTGSCNYVTFSSQDQCESKPDMLTSVDLIVCVFAGLVNRIIARRITSYWDTYIELCQKILTKERENGICVI